MLTKKIDSLQHPLVKRWVKLRSDRAYREETQAVLVVGKKMIQELPLQKSISLDPSPSLKAEEHYQVTEEILKKITGLQQPDGYAAEVALPPSQDLSHCRSLLVLDQIADPGNLGTLLRTALALSWEGVIVTPSTVDLFNDKALRAAKGATFRLPYACMTPEEISALLHKKQFHVFTADLKGKSLDTLTFKGPVCLILSNESQGPSPWSKKISQTVTIPMNHSVESLNVATSGSILLYTMRPQ